MKKYLLAALVVLSTSAMAGNVTVYGGIDMNGKLESSMDSSLYVSQNEKVDSG